MVRPGAIISVHTPWCCRRGIQGGQVYGASNATGYEPAEQACGPPDLHATIFHAMGIDPSNYHDP